MAEEFNPSERNVLGVALRGEVDMRRYAPEVVTICAKLGLPEPKWMDEEAVRERLGRD